VRPTGARSDTVLLQLQPPYRSFDGAGSRTLAGFSYGGDTTALENFVRLTPDRASKRGWLWGDRPLNVTSFSATLTFRVSGQGSQLFGDGLGASAAAAALVDQTRFGSTMYTAKVPFHYIELYGSTFRCCGGCVRAVVVWLRLLASGVRAVCVRGFDCKCLAREISPRGLLERCDVARARPPSSPARKSCGARRAALWFVSSPTHVDGPLHGFGTKFTGFGVVLDTFVNAENAATHKDVALYVGTGEVRPAAHGTGFEGPAGGGCDANYRFVRRPGARGRRWLCVCAWLCLLSAC
jgi:hypothetical protein